MIVRLNGKLCEVSEGAVIVERSGLAYEVLVPGSAVGELASCRGQQVLLHTLEFFEGNANGAVLVPRLIGFLHEEDKLFFGHLIAVKGIGIRKALKAFCEASSRIARWITDGDTKQLERLPGIGARAAQLIVAELQGKVDKFAMGVSGAPALAAARWTQQQQDALEVMVAWGDTRPEAEQWLLRAVQLHADLESADEWVTACYRIKSGSEG